jgi:hypothetical protein
MNWNLEIIFHWPHDRFALGWEFINSTNDCNYKTFTLYLFIVTLSLNVEENNI